MSDVSITPIRRKSRLRFVLIAFAVLSFFAVSSLRGFAVFWTDYLWFHSIGRTDVWGGVLSTKIWLTVGFCSAAFLVLWMNLFVADRFRPDAFAGNLPLNDEIVLRFRQMGRRNVFLLRTLISFLLALFLAAGVGEQWQSWLLFRHKQSFGVSDPQFKRDVGFYIFQLPFYTFFASWLFLTLLMVSVAVAVAHYFNGGIRSAAAAGTGPRISQQVKVHLSVLLGLVALSRALQYWLQRFQLLYSTRGEIADGANYTDVKYQLPAYNLLIVISIVACLLLIANVVRKGWTLPAVATSLWVVVSVVLGSVFPAAIQELQVKSQGVKLESPYIERNIAATRASYGFEDPKTGAPLVETVAYGEASQGLLTQAEADASKPSLDDVPVWDSINGVATDTFSKLEGSGKRQFLKLSPLLDDRYSISGDAAQTPTVVAVRNVNISALGENERTWSNRHLRYTHGYGVALADAAIATSSGNPDFTLNDIPLPRTSNGSVPEFRVYFGDGLNDYIIANNGNGEIDYSAGTDPTTATSSYDGSGGVELSSSFRRLAYALRYNDQKIFFSGSSIKSDSRIIQQRDVKAIVKKAAPFLDIDSTATPVATSTGISWIVDGYTTSDHYPYAQRINSDVQGRLSPGSGLKKSLNYARDAVKAVVDAYTGDVTFYVIDQSDPIINAYIEAFPSMFHPASEMPQELRDHTRYPPDLFKIQSSMYGKYRLTDPTQFASNNDFAWEVVQEGGIGSADATAGDAPAVTDPATQKTKTSERKKQEPQYQLMSWPGDESQNTQFVATQAFGPPQRQDASGSSLSTTLTGLMSAGSEWGQNYGKLRVLDLKASKPLPDIVNMTGALVSDQRVAQFLTPLSKEGSAVVLGRVRIVPVGSTLVYMRPLLLRNSSSTPYLSQVIVSANNNIRMDPTVDSALRRAIADPPNTQESRPLPGIGAGGTGIAPTTTTPITTTPNDPNTSSTTTQPGATTTVPTMSSDTERLAAVKKALDEADAARRSGDLALLQLKLDEARALSAATVTTSTTIARDSGSGSSGSGNSGSSSTTTIAGVTTTKTA